jgi:hypothetical protein
MTMLITVENNLTGWSGIKETGETAINDGLLDF